MDGDDRLRQDLYAAFKNRALIYRHLFETLRDELGEERATALMSRAIEARGREIGRAFARHAPADLAGLRDAFLAVIPDGGRMFAPEVVRCDAGGLDIRLTRCPLQDAWREAGVPEPDIARLCRIAGRIDNGTFEAAGFAFSADTWQPGRDGCCFLHIRPGPPR
ncbi:MAG TPA: L-2-amino-thiazoline-4-carboxylic acid hydrolase [Candidatus Tectomicrobia bacterium]|nr:L-2-amino-thiazoline-4-carboxylic acid hydrolase [Candidatus Tectomicrobia bacterium]